LSGQADAASKHELGFEAYGVRIAVGTSSPELLEEVRRYLPPGSTPCPPSTAEHRYELAVEDAGTYAVRRDGDVYPGAQGVELDIALELLDSKLRLYIGRKAPDAIFVHAGAVAHGDRAIVMPGMSFTGKTTLVAELVRLGAIYYSDEFAVLDRDGRLHPYAKSLSIRGNGWAQTDHPVDSLGGIAGERPLPLAAIVVTSFRRDAEWKPRRLSAGEGALALIGNAVPAQERPAEVMRVAGRAARGALIIESERPDAEAAAPLLLAEIERLAA
jgi:hypothetical protein